MSKSKNEDFRLTHDLMFVYECLKGALSSVMNAYVVKRKVTG